MTVNEICLLMCEAERRAAVLMLQAHDILTENKIQLCKHHRM